jgi:hypothetical protein
VFRREPSTNVFPGFVVSIWVSPLSQNDVNKNKKRTVAGVAVSTVSCFCTPAIESPPSSGVRGSTLDRAHRFPFTIVFGRLTFARASTRRYLEIRLKVQDHRLSFRR